MKIKILNIILLGIVLYNCSSNESESEVCKAENDIILSTLGLVMNESSGTNELENVMVGAYISCERKQLENRKERKRMLRIPGVF
ncbi:hypothetical protein P3G55_20580 [Leptospira sp. 96542]|nr:hypothetical protein [Leptospira sp. 96542]